MSRISQRLRFRNVVGRQAVSGGQVSPPLQLGKYRFGSKGFSLPLQSAAALHSTIARSTESGELLEPMQHT